MTRFTMQTLAHTLSVFITLAGEEQQGLVVRRRSESVGQKLGNFTEQQILKRGLDSC